MEGYQRTRLLCEYECVYVYLQADDGIRDLVRSRGLEDVYKRRVCVCVLCVLCLCVCVCFVVVCVLRVVIWCVCVCVLI